MQCTNNLKQLGLAVQNFNDTNNRFPNQNSDEYWMQGFRQYGTNSSLGGVDIYSVFSLILPYIEQQPLTTRITGLCQDAANDPTNSKRAPLAWRADKASDGGENPFCAVVSAYLCPSDGNTADSSGSGALAPCNYAANRGDWVVGSNWAHNNKKRGVFYDGSRGGRATLATITDGTSNTMLFSELTASNPSGSDLMYRTTIAEAKVQSSDGAAACAATRGADGMTKAAKQWPQKGRRWGDARGPFHNFQAALPPNSPSCYQGDGSGNPNESSSCLCVSASSNHSGGVNVVMCDGSVRFVSETIDCGDIQHGLGYPANTDGDWAWTGPSTRGVWGAMATPKGGETVSAP